MRIVIAQVLMVAMAGAASAGPMEQLRAGAAGPGAARAEVPAVSAPSVPPVPAAPAGKSCFALSGDPGSGLPASFCVAGLGLRGSGDGLELRLFSDDRGVKGGKASYVSLGGARYVSSVVYSYSDQVSFREIELLAPVDASGALLPGGLKAEARASYSPSGSHQQFQLSVRYSPSAASGPLTSEAVCFARQASGMADKVGLPASFCVAGASLERRADGWLLLSLGGDLAGTFSAEYEKRGGETYARANVFVRSNGFENVDRGLIDLLVPVKADGSADASRISVDAKAGHNDCEDYAPWTFTDVPYALVK